METLNDKPPKYQSFSYSLLELQEACNKWNHYEQSNFFNQMGLYNLSITTIRVSSLNFRTTISYLYKNIQEKISSEHKIKSTSKSIAIARFFDINELLWQEFEKIDTCGVDMPGHYSFINRLNQDKSLQKHYKINNVYFTFSKMTEGNFMCNLIINNIPPSNYKNISKVNISKRKAQDNCVLDFISYFNVDATGEMDEGTLVSDGDSLGVAPLGSTPLISNKQQETILTSDVPVASTLPLIPIPRILQTASTTSIITEEKNLTDRWIALEHFRIERETGVTDQPYKFWSFPEHVLQKAPNSPNVLLFKQYMLCQPTQMEIKFVFNSNKFNQGLMVASYLNDGVQLKQGDLTTTESAWLSYCSINQVLQRDHIVMDFNTSNEGVLTIPYISTRNFVPIFDKPGEDSYTSALVTLHVLSALRVPDEAQSFIDGTMYFRFSKVSFTALRPSVDIIATGEGGWGDKDDPYAEEEAIRTEYINAMVYREENYLPTCSIEEWKIDNNHGLPTEEVINYDSDEDVEATGEIGVGAMALGALIPSIMKPIGNAIGGIGTSILGAIGGLFSPIFGKTNPQRRIENGEARFNIQNQSVNLDKPAKIKQPNEFRPNFVGDTSIATFSEPKLSMRLDPTVLTPQYSSFYPNTTNTSIAELNRIWSLHKKFTWSVTDQTVGQNIATFDILPSDFVNTVFGYFSNMYTYYSGTIELMFYVVGTQFHVGALDISFIPFTNDFTAEQGRSSFYKLFYLKDERQFTFSIPFINTTVLRLVDAKSYSDEPLGQVKVFVRNALVPIQSVTQEVEIVVFAKAGDDFHYSILQQPKLDIIRTPIEAIGEMDDGSDIVQEPTSEYNLLSHSGVACNIGEDHELIPDIIKRYVKSYSFNDKSVYSFNIGYPFSNITDGPQTNTSNMVLNCYRFVRGSYSLMLNFKKRTTPPSRRNQPDDVTIIDLNTTPNCVVDNLANPPSIQSTVPPATTSITPGEFETFSNTFDIYPSPSAWRAEDDGGDLIVRHPTSSSTTADVDNGVFVPIQNTFNSAVISTSNNADTYNTDAANITTAFNNTTTNFDSIKTVMDSNTGVNSYLQTVTTSHNKMNECVNTLRSSYNTNITNTNANNVSLVQAIDDSGGSIVAAETPVFIKIIYSPLNIAGASYSGNPSQYITTSINSSVKINLPYYSMYNYQDWLVKSQKPLTKLSQYIGTLTIQADANVDMDGYWTAGDDFYMTKFIGIPYNNKVVTTSNEIVEDVMENYYANGEMDEALLDTLLIKPATNFLAKSTDRGYASFCRKVKENPVINVGSTIQKIDTLSDKANNILENIQETATKVVEFIKSKFTWLANTQVLMSSIIHLLQAFLNPTKVSILLAISGVIINLGLLTTEAVQKIFDLIKTKLSATQQTSAAIVYATGECEHSCTACERLLHCHSNCKNCSDQRGIFDESTCALLSGLVLASISSLLGLKTVVSSQGLCAGLFRVSSTFWTSLTHSTKFLKDFILLIKRAYGKIVRNNQDTELAAILTNSPDQIREFVLEVQLMTNQLNRSAIQTDPTYKRRFWMCVVTAYTLQSKFVMETSPMARNVLHVCDKIINLSNELAIPAVNCPVRYEPYVLALMGKSNLGKSYMANALVPNLLKDVYNWQDYMAPIFTRTPGVEYWNNYVGQPVILYDDFLASTNPEIASRQIIEMYNLKSSAIMNCNMADIADKKMFANPLMVLQIMNKHIVPTGITEPSAFKRRKDGFWNVIENPEKKLKDYTREEKAQFKHLLFEYIRNPLRDDLRESPVPYSVFFEKVKKDTLKYHEQEKLNVKFRFDKLKLTLPINAQQMLCEVDPCGIFYKTAMQVSEASPVQTGLLPSEELSLNLATISNIRDMVNREIQNTPQNPLPSTSSSHFATGEGLFDDIKQIPRRIKEFITKFPRTPRQLILRFLYGTSYQHYDATVGSCSSCLSDDIDLFYHCDSQVPHGFCEPCYRIGLNAGGIRSTCGVCQGSNSLNFSRYVHTWSELYELTKTKVINTTTDVYHYIMDRALYIPILYSVLVFLVSCLLSRVIAPLNCSSQEFIHDVFEQPFYGGVEKGFFYHSYKHDLHKPEGVEVNKGLIPFKMEDGNNQRLWNFMGIYETEEGNELRFGENYQTRDSYTPRYHNLSNNDLITNHFHSNDARQILNNRTLSYDDKDLIKSILNPEQIHDIFDKPEIFFELEGESDILPEVYGNFNIWPKKMLKRHQASAIECIHVNLLNKPLDRVSYEVNIVNGEQGYWIYDTSKIPDVICCNNCKFAETRPHLIKMWCAKRSSLIALALRKIDCQELNMSKCYIPIDYINPLSINQPDPEVEELLLQLNSYNQLSFFDKVCEKFGTLFKGITIALTAAGFIISLLKGCQFVYGMFKSQDDDISGDNIKCELNPSGDFKSYKLQRHSKAPRSIFARGESNAEHLELAIKKIARNSVIMNIKAEVLISDEVKKRDIYFRCLGIFGTTIMMTKHEFFTAHFLQEECIKNKLQYKITIKSFSQVGMNDPDKEMDFTIDLSKVFLTNSDLVFIELPPRMPQFKDITNLIASRTQHCSLVRELTFIKVDKHSNVIQKVYTKMTQRIAQVTTVACELHESIKSFDVYSSEFRGKGACGSIGLISSNSPIFCMHFAGDDVVNKGFSVPLVREDILKYKANKAPFCFIDPDVTEGKCNIKLEGDYNLMGVVKRDKIPYQSSQTKIIPSLIHGKIEDTKVLTQPAILSNRDERYVWDGSPLKYGCEKRCRPPIDLPQNLVDIAYDEVCQEILTHCHPTRLQIGKLDLTDAILGFNGIDFYDRLKLSTSTGYPYNLNPGQTSKNSLIVIEEDKLGNPIEVKVNNNLIAVLDENEELRKKGIRPITIFQNTLKDERKSDRKLSKKDGTRVFEQSPVDYTIALRQYTLDFSASYMKNRHFLGHAVGCTQDGPEWRLIGQKLLQIGNNIVSGDFTDFGPRVWYQLIKASGNIIKAWYKQYLPENADVEEYCLILDVLISEIATSYNICNNVVYQVFCGLPSGNSLTVILNTICHKLLIRVCWLGIMEEYGLQSLDNFNKYVVDIEYGDDGLISVHDRIKEHFNCETIAKYLKKYDFIFTDAEKIGNVKYTKISKASFLKRGFKNHPRLNEFLAPLEMKSITEAPQWIFKSSDDTMATLENCKQSLNLAYGHGPEFFEIWKKKLNKALANVNLELLTTTWEQLDRLFFEGQEFNIRFDSNRDYGYDEEEENFVDKPIRTNQIAQEIKNNYVILPSEVSKILLAQEDKRCSKMN